MPSQVVTTRRVKRRQQRQGQRFVSKNAKRKVRSVRKHRKTAKKVMRGGVFDTPVPIQCNIYLEGNQDTPGITLTTSKNRFASNYTIKLMFNVDVFKGDVRELLGKLFTSGGGKIVYQADTNVGIPQRMKFLLGLADASERTGVIQYALAEAAKAGTAEVEMVTQKIKDLTTNNKCDMEIESSKSNTGGLKFTVTNYSRIYPEKCGEYSIPNGSECVRESWDFGCNERGGKFLKVSLFCPILKNNGDANITFINWDNGFKKGVYKRIPNENTFTIIDTTSDIKIFLERFNKPKILKTDGTLIDAPAPTTTPSDNPQPPVSAL
jgi:hypothetical protein